MEITEKELEQETKLTKIVKLFTGLTFEQWQVMEKLINKEFERKACENRLNDYEAEKIMRQAAKELNLRFL